MDNTFRYKVGLINWEVAIGDNEITVKGWGGPKIIKQDKIIESYKKITDQDKPDVLITI